MKTYVSHAEAALTTAEYKRREPREVKMVRRALLVVAAVCLPSGLLILEFEPWSAQTSLIVGLAALALFVAIEVTLLFAAYNSLGRLVNRLVVMTMMTVSLIAMIAGLSLMVRSAHPLPGFGLLLLGATGLAAAMGMLLVPQLRRTSGHRPPR